MTLLAALGRQVLGLLALVGRVAIYAGETVAHIVRPPFYPRNCSSSSGSSAT
jgi:phospholipid/cholesterol/gamma-HCH transport system permease protein